MSVTDVLNISQKTAVRVNVDGPNLWQVNVDLGDLVPPGNEPLSEPIINMFCDAVSGVTKVEIIDSHFDRIGQI